MKRKRPSHKIRFVYLLSVLLCILTFSGCTTDSNRPEFHPSPRPQGGPTAFKHQQDNIAVSTATSGATPETSSPTPSQSPAPTITATPTQTLPPATFYNFDEGVNPLTGLRVKNPALLERRPVMVKVSNWPRIGRPHAGLSSADIVFEYYIGYQMNRFLAIYYGKNASLIGPVRSGRLVDAQLTDLYQGLLAYGDADPGVEEALVNTLGERALTFRFLPCPAMCGQTTHSATGVFANSDELSRYADQMGINNQQPDLRGMYFQPEPPKGDEHGSFISFEYADFSVMQWHYDASSGLYDLWQDAEADDGSIILYPTVDRNNNQRVSFANIVILYANYIEYTPSLHDIEIKTSSSYQPALLFRDGEMIYGTWRAAYANRPLNFETLDGESMPFKPGNTWIIIAGNHTITEQVKVGHWEFSFDLP